MKCLNNRRYYILDIKIVKKTVYPILLRNWSYVFRFTKSSSILFFSHKVKIITLIGIQFLVNESDQRFFFII